MTDSLVHRHRMNSQIGSKATTLLGQAQNTSDVEVGQYARSRRGTPGHRKLGYGYMAV